MNTQVKMISLLGAALFAASALTVQAANAGAPSHVMPAGYGQAQPSYALEIAAPPQQGKPLLVRLVDTANDRAVTDARVSVLRPLYAGIKAVPQVQYVAIPLASDGQGDFVCAGDHHEPGRLLTLRGTVPGDARAVWAAARVRN
jgi:hypothetical protein